MSSRLPLRVYIPKVTPRSLRCLTAHENSSAVLAAVVGEPANLTNGDSHCVEKGRSLHMLPASVVCCVTISEASVTSFVVTAEAARASLRRATAEAAARASSKCNCSSRHAAVQLPCAAVIGLLRQPPEMFAVGESIQLPAETRAGPTVWQHQESRRTRRPGHVPAPTCGE